MLKIRECVKNLIPYVGTKQRDEVQGDFGTEEIYDLSANENPLGPPLSAIEAINVVAPKSARYPKLDDKTLLSAMCRGLNIKESEIVFGCGSGEILKLLALSFLEPGDEVIVPYPTYTEYERTATLYGGICRRIPLNQDKVIDLPAMAGAISTKTKIIYICNPNNPTGTVIDKRSLLQMLHRVGSDILVVLDEAYGEYNDDPNSPDGIEIFHEFPNVVVTRTFSHAYGLAGLRIGYALGDERIINILRKVREPYTISMSAQAGALAAWQDREYIKKSVDYNKVEREYLAVQLELMGIKTLPSQANFLLLETNLPGKTVYNKLLEAGIAVCSGETFGLSQAIRVSVGLHKENECFLAKLKEVLAGE